MVGLLALVKKYLKRWSGHKKNYRSSFFKEQSCTDSRYSPHDLPYLFLLLIMQLHKIALADTHSFSSFFLDYISQKDTLKSFYHRFPLTENFKGQIQEKKSFAQQNLPRLETRVSRYYSHHSPSPSSVLLSASWSRLTGCPLHRQSQLDSTR